MKPTLSLRSLAAALVFASLCSMAFAAPSLRLLAQAHQAPIWFLSVDAKEQLLLSASDDKTAKLWDVATGRLIRSFFPPATPGSGRLAGAALSPDGETVALGSGYKQLGGGYAIYFYKAADGSPLTPLTNLPGAANQVSFSRDGRWLAANVRQAGVVIYDTRNWQPVIREQCSACLRGQLAFSADSHMLAASDDNGAVWTYRLRGDQWAVQARTQLPQALTKLALHPAGTWVALGREDGSPLLVLDGQTLAVAHKPELNLRNVLTRAVAWSADGRSLYAAGLWYAPRGRQAEKLVKRWDDEGRGAATDLRSPNLGYQVSSLLPLRNGALLTGAVDGDLVQLDADGREAYAVSNELNLPVVIETAANPEMLRVAEDGSAIEFRRPRDVLASGFLLAERRWGTRPGVGWAPRGLRAPNALLEDWAQSTAPRLNGKALDLGPGRRAMSYAFSPDGQWLAVGTNRNLQVFDVASGARVRNLPTNQGVTGVRFFKGGQALAIQFFDGQVAVLRVRDFQRLLELFLHPNGRDWALYTPGGYFDASPAAEALLAWHVTHADEVNTTVFPFSRFAEFMQRPDVVDRVLAELKTDRELLGLARPKQPVADSTEEDGAGETAVDGINQAARAPQASLEVAPRALEPDARSVTLLVGAKDQGDGVTELRVFHNGKALPVEWNPQRGKATVRSVLLAGDNEFRAVAIGTSRIEGVPAVVRVANSARPEAASSAAGRLHLVVVAVTRYRNGALDLGYPVKDAQALVAAVKQTPFTRVHGEPVLHTLYDRDANAAAVRGLFERLRREVRAEDTVLVFLAGHGEMDADEWYFVPEELETPEVPERLKAGGLSRSFWQQALRELPARRVLMMIDACKSGGALTRSVEARRALTQLARSSGTYILAATQADQKAWELPNIGHGLFTYAVLESLKAAPSGKQLSVEKLITQVKSKMPELAEQNSMVRQVPVSFGLGTDFPLALFD